MSNTTSTHHHARLEALATLHGERGWRVARTLMGNDADAADVLQQSFLVLAKDAEQRIAGQVTMPEGCHGVSRPIQPSLQTAEKIPLAKCGRLVRLRSVRSRFGQSATARELVRSRCESYCTLSERILYVIRTMFSEPQRRVRVSPETIYSSLIFKPTLSLRVIHSSTVKPLPQSGVCCGIILSFVRRDRSGRFRSSESFGKGPPATTGSSGLPLPS